MDDDSPPVMFVFDDVRQPLLPAWVVTCFTINVIMGSGFLGVPSGFLDSGLLLGPLVLVVVSILQWIAACMLAQVASRAHALLTSANAASTLTPTLQPLARSEIGGGAATRQQRPNPPSLHLPAHTSYEIMMLCRLFLGRWAERTVMISTALYMIGTTWSFISVFASSMTAMVPLRGLLGEGLDIAPCDVRPLALEPGALTSQASATTRALTTVPPCAWLCAPRSPLRPRVGFALRSTRLTCTGEAASHSTTSGHSGSPY